MGVDRPSDSRLTKYRGRSLLSGKKAQWNRYASGDGIPIAGLIFFTWSLMSVLIVWGGERKLGITNRINHSIPICNYSHKRSQS